MTKKDLKTSMRVKLRNESELVVLKDTPTEDVLCSIGGGCMILSHYRDDLTHKVSSIYDIVSVLEADCQINLLRADATTTLIWGKGVKQDKPILTLDGVDYSEDTLRSLIKKATHGDKGA